MRYINPFSLLKISPQELLVSTNILRKAKRKILAEIELEDFVIVDGEKIEKTDALRSIDELDYEDKKEFHSLIFYDEDLRKFLSHGNRLWFFSPKDSQGFNYPPFKDFIAPYYAPQFNNLLCETIEKGDLKMIRLLEDSPVTLEGEYYDVSRRGAKDYYLKKIRKLEDLYDEVVATKSSPLANFNHSSYRKDFYNPFQSPFKTYIQNNFESTFIEKQDIATINELSNDFQFLRDKIANNLRNIGVEISNSLEEYELFEILLEEAAKIKCGMRLQDLIREDLNNVKERLNKNKLVILIRLLDKILDDIKRKRFLTSKEIKSAVNSVVDISALNSLPSGSYNNSSIITVANQVSEIAILVNDFYDDGNTAFEIIDKILEIRIKDSNIGTELLRKLVADRYEISLRKKPIEKNERNKTEEPKSQSKNARESTSNQKSSNTAPPRQKTTTRYSKNVDDLFSSYYGQSESAAKREINYFSVLKNTIPENITWILLILLAVSAFLGIYFVQADMQSGLERQDKISATSANILHSPDTNNTSLPTAPTPKLEITRPDSGAEMLKNGKKGGLGKLKISNGTDNDAIAKLVDTTTGKTYRQVYIWRYTYLTITNIRQGRYYLMFATGRDYAPSIAKFTSDQSYEKFDEILEYTEIREISGVKWKEYSATLNPVSYGNARTSSVGESDFADK